MGDQQRLEFLCARLRELRAMQVQVWQRPILEAAMQGVQEEIEVTTRSLRRWAVAAPSAGPAGGGQGRGSAPGAGG